MDKFKQFRKTNMSKNPHRHILIGVTLMIVLLAVIGCIVAWVLSVENTEPASRTIKYKRKNKETLGAAQIELGNDQSIGFHIGPSVSGSLGLGIVNPTSYQFCSSDGDVCVMWEGDRKLLMTKRDIDNAITCYDISWIALASVSQELTDCINLTGHWYGGFQDFHQYWPMNTIQQKMAPYVASDSYAKMYGGVLERYFVSSSGTGLYIEKDVPLHLAFNEANSRQICLTAKYTKYPYINYDNSLPYLNYTICQSGNIRKIHDYMSKTYIPRPSNIPDEKLFRDPIWSTWAMYKKDINETQLEDFANEIVNNSFPHSQIELDDDWTVKYGDMDFIRDKFPDPAAMIRRLNSLGFRVTIWLHPFFNIDSNAFAEAALNNFLIRQYDSLQPALVSWWRGRLSGILDVTNTGAVDWYLSKLSFLKTTYNVSSFKFDAGEVNWLPKIYRLNTTYRNPDVYPQKWAELAYRSDQYIRHQEVRVGARSQHLPIFIRMLDRDSRWTQNNGLKTLIPCALTFGLIGYPFVLPDMIGGNAYDASAGLEARNYPKPDLFMRWLQVNTFLPSMQFSVPPWIYDNSTFTDKAREFVQLHQEYTPIIVKLAREATTTGNPIIRPLWWVAPDDEQTFTIDDEYLLGDDILVAPVVTEGATSRDIYIPAGSWQDRLRNQILQGGRWYRNYAANLYELPYFTRV